MGRDLKLQRMGFRIVRMITRKQRMEGLSGVEGILCAMYVELS